MLFNMRQAIYQAGSGESGSEALMRRSMSCLASSYIPDADASTHISNANLFHSAGPNGGGPQMRTDACKFPCGAPCP